MDGNFVKVVLDTVIFDLLIKNTDNSQNLHKSLCCIQDAYQDCNTDYLEKRICPGASVFVV
jgi:hypothetical protein